MRRFLFRYGWEALLTVTVFLALSAAFQFQGLVALFGQLSHHLIILFLAIILGRAVSLLSIRREIGILLDQHRRTDKVLRRPVGLYLQIRLSELQHVRDALSGEKGEELSLAGLERFVAACFSANRGKSYVGTDSNVPTAFYRLYPTYLDSQFSAMPSGKAGRDARIMFKSEAELRTDYAIDEPVFRVFYEAHVLHDVRLLQVEEKTAARVAAIQRLPSTDIGIFGRDFVVFFLPEVLAGTPANYRIHVRPLESHLRDQLREYVRMLNAHAKEVRLENGVVTCIKRDSHTTQDDERRLLWGLRQ